ncbi:MAG: hypothetical protein QOE70_4375 [Chthoniobacter sp.]|jgi:hypothetical protein|nr:hypothetical protein [Chthoniobacter sp.]
MPLLDYSLDPAPIDPAQQEADHILADTAGLHQQCVRSVQAIYTRIWANPLATPAAILAKLGPRATPLFILSAQFQELLNVARPGSIALAPPVMPEFHADGTVTLPEE